MITDGGIGLNGGGGGGAAVTGRYRRWAKQQEAQAKAAPGLAALLNGAGAGGKTPGKAYQAGRRAKIKAEMPSNLATRKSPTKAQLAYQRRHPLATSLSPKKTTAAAAETTPAHEKRQPQQQVDGGVKVTTIKDCDAAAGRTQRKDIGGKAQAKQTGVHTKVTSPPRVRAAMTMAEMRRRKNGSTYVLIDV
eukprot:SAG31_NODE_1459_length_8254_cov_4.297854_2_plen_191_part_00